MAELLDLLRAAGLLTDPHATAHPLGGGVSSEIALVQDGGRRFVVKRALARLKVADEWLADLSRNRYECEYLLYVADLLPGAVPKVLARGDGFFVMEHLGEEFFNWKQLLLAGTCEPAHASAAGAILGRIHLASSMDAQVAGRFQTLSNFRQLRIDPYLLTTGLRHPALRPEFEACAADLAQHAECLVHGDFSPKNILISHDRMVVLDCEVAWFGDPAFDLAFLLNHLALKALYHAPRATALPALAASALEAYFGERPLDQLARGRLEARAARLLLLLLLARVDGKSPVEYLTAAKQEFVRTFTRRRIGAAPLTLAMLLDDWFESIKADSSL